MSKYKLFKEKISFRVIVEGIEPTRADISRKRPVTRDNGGCEANNVNLN